MSASFIGTASNRIGTIHEVVILLTPSTDLYEDLYRPSFAQEFLEQARQWWHRWHEWLDFLTMVRRRCAAPYRPEGSHLVQWARRVLSLPCLPRARITRWRSLKERRAAWGRKLYAAE